MPRSTTKTKNKDFEVKFEFKYCKIDVFCNPDAFDQDSIKKIESLVKQMSKDIWIDKSYVTYPGTKYMNTYIREVGWNELKKLMKDSDFGKKLTNLEYLILIESYKQLIIGYMYVLLKNYGYDTDEILIDVKDHSRFMSFVYIDNDCGWKTYPGKWQTWKRK